MADPQPVTLLSWPTYTIGEIDDASALIERNAMDALEQVLRAELAFAYPRAVIVPPTRLQRVKARLWDYRWRISTAIDVLRDRHDCYDY